MIIGGKEIGEGAVFLCAEVGSLTDGKLETALQLVDAAKQAGANAIKFIASNPDLLFSDKNIQYEGKSNYDAIKAYQMSDSEWVALAQYCEQVGMTWYASVGTIDYIDLLESLNCPVYKVGSWDLRNFPLLRELAMTGKPLMIDLGPAIYGEVATVLNDLAEYGAEDVMLIHCTHAKSLQEMNMLTIPYLRHEFGTDIGWSADSRDDLADIMAVSLGTDLIEKRLTLNKEGDGHHKKALEPLEFAAWAQKIRSAEAMLGEWGLFPSLKDIAHKNDYFTSLVFGCDVDKGEIITEDMLQARRPGNGISPYYDFMFIGKPAPKDYSENDLVLPGDFIA